MRRTVLILLACLVVAVPAAAQRTSKFEALTITDSSTAITAATLAGMTTCTAVLETAEVRWRNDGTAPTSTVGTPLAAGTAIYFSNTDDARRARFIRTGGSNGVLSINCFETGGVTEVSGGGSVAIASLPADATELGAAAALGDNLTPPSSPFVFALLYCWDATGGNADRCTSGDTTFGTSTFTEATSTGPLVGGVRNDTPDSLVNTTNETAPIGINANGAVWTSTIDPCSSQTKSTYVVNISTATTVEIANAIASQQWRICSVNLVAAAAQTIAIAIDDTDGCGSLTEGLHGGATAATGWSFAANGGIALGDGTGTVMTAPTANRYLCAITGQAAQISGTIVYVSAP